MPALPKCLLEPKSVVTSTEDTVTTYKFIIADPDKFKAAIAAGVMTNDEIPNSLPINTPIRIEKYTECRFEDKSNRDTGDSISCGVDCEVVDVHYVCEFHTRTIWRFRGFDIVIADSLSTSDSFDVMKSVLICPGGASVIPGVKPYPRDAFDLNQGTYNPALDTLAGQDCPPATASQPRLWPSLGSRPSSRASRLAWKASRTWERSK